MRNTFNISFPSSSKELMNDSSHSSRIQICSLLLLLIFITSCNGHDKTMDSVNESKTGPIILPETRPVVPVESSLSVEDTSIVEPKDVTSTHGPHSITRNIFQDRNGTYWFASWESLISYDGKLFTNVTFKEGLKHFHFFSILEDKTGKLWFGTIGGGVYYYDPVSGRFTYFTTRDGLAGNDVMCMLADKSMNIWFGTQGGISRYDGKSFTNFTIQDGLSSNFISSIVQDKTGKLWIGSNGGINCYDPSVSASTSGNFFISFRNEKGLDFYRVRSIIEDKTGNIWIGSADGLCRYDPSASLKSGGKSFTNFTNSTYYVFEDRAGNLWLSDGKLNSPEMTLTKYDGKSFTTIKSNKQIFGITEDRTGNIWFGTVNGACSYDGNSFTTFNN